MASKDDVQAQNLILYGYHDTEFKVEKSGLRKQSKDESWEDVLSIWDCEKDSGVCGWREQRYKSGEEPDGRKGSDWVWEAVRSNVW